MWFAVSAAWAEEAAPPALPADVEATVDEAATDDGTVAPEEETAAAAEETGEEAPHEDDVPKEAYPEKEATKGISKEEAYKEGAFEETALETGAGEATTGGRLPGSDFVDRLRERASKSPAANPDERLARLAKTASRIIRPLPQPFAIAATVVGFILMLFGQRLFRTGIVLYFMALLGMIGREMGVQFGGGTGALIGGSAGCLLGAGAALPLRALVRALVGGLTGGILASILVQSFTSDIVVTLVMVAVGITVSGLLTFFFPKPLLVIGFALFGAVTASIGVLSFATDPVIVDGGEHLAYGGAHIAGVLLATALGVLFQSHLGDAEGDDD
jgi:hypothetical protein